MKAKRIWWKELEKELLGDQSPLNQPKATTVRAAIRTDGVFAIRQRNTGSGPASGRHRHHG